MRVIDTSRWPRLSPLLDELLDLPGAERVVRLQAIRLVEADLADDLEELLRRQDGFEASAFLAEPALAAAPAGTGQVVGPYTLERELGQGGMGVVWLARRTDGRYEGQVAIKFLSPGLFGQADAGRFAREGQILARLAHPNIAGLIDAGVLPQGGAPYLVLEYIDGLPITRYAEAQGLEPRQLAELFLGVLAAVAHAHTRLILHRDLKPSNILVNRAGEVKLLDFGVAKLLSDAGQAAPGAAEAELTQRVGRAFTPQFAAPEQVTGEEVTTATDVYALGVLLYLLLSGRHPTSEDLAPTQDTLIERMRALVETEPRRLSDQVRALGGPDAGRRARELRGDLDTIVARALKKSPVERYPNAAAMADDLRHWLAHEPISARPDSAGYRTAKFIRRHPWGVGASVLAVATLASLTGLSLAQARRAERAEQLALQRSAQADDLLGFMLGEFADKLRPLGRLELLSGVGAKALAHLGAAPDVQTSPVSLLQRAKALTVLGEVSVAKRELGAATEPLQAARRVLGEQPPVGSPAALVKDWRISQGAAAFWLGHVHYLQRDFGAARTAWTDYQRYSQALVDDAPDDPDARVELSYARNSLGTLLLDSGDLPGATDNFKASIALKEEAMAMRPDDLGLRNQWIDSQQWLGTVLEWRGEFEAARVVFADALTHIEPVLQKAPSDLGWVYHKAVIQQYLGKCLRELHQTEPARAALQAATTTIRRLLAQQPANRVWWLGLARAEAELANAEPGGSLQAVASLRSMLAQMDAASQTSALGKALAERAQLALALGRHLAAAGQRPEALALLTAELPALDNAVAKRPDALPLISARARLRLTVADLQMAEAGSAGRPTAQAACADVLRQLEPARAQRRLHYEITRAWADAQRCVGETTDSGADREWLQARDGNRH